MWLTPLSVQMSFCSQTRRSAAPQGVASNRCPVYRHAAPGLHVAKLGGFAHISLERSIASGWFQDMKETADGIQEEL